MQCSSRIARVSQSLSYLDSNGALRNEETQEARETGQKWFHRVVKTAHRPARFARSRFVRPDFVGIARRNCFDPSASAPTAVVNIRTERSVRTRCGFKRSLPRRRSRSERVEKKEEEKKRKNKGWSGTTPSLLHPPSPPPLPLRLALPPCERGCRRKFAATRSRRKEGGARGVGGGRGRGREKRRFDVLRCASLLGRPSRLDRTREDERDEKKWGAQQP